MPILPAASSPASSSSASPPMSQNTSWINQLKKKDEFAFDMTVPLMERRFVRTQPLPVETSRVHPILDGQSAWNRPLPRPKLRIPEAFAAQHCDGLTLLPKFLTGSKQTPDTTSLFQAFQTQRPWKTVRAFLKAESNSCVKATIRRAKKSFLVHQAMGFPLIVAIDVQANEMRDTKHAVWHYRRDNIPIEDSESTDPCATAETTEEWAVRVDTQKQRRFISTFASQNAERFRIKQHGSETQEMLILASVETFNEMIAWHEKAVGDTVTTPLSYAILDDFMGDHRIRTQATIVATFKAGVSRYEHLGNVRKLAAKICHLGGSTLVTEGVLRMQANDDQHLLSLLEEANKWAVDGCFYPARPDVKRDACLITPPSSTPQVGPEERVLALTSPDMLLPAQWQTAAAAMEVQIADPATIAQGHMTWVRAPVAASRKSLRFRWGTVHLCTPQEITQSEVNDPPTPPLLPAATPSAPANASAATPLVPRHNGRGFGTNTHQLAGRGAGVQPMQRRKEKEKEKEFLDGDDDDALSSGHNNNNTNENDE